MTERRRAPTAAHRPDHARRPRRRLPGDRPGDGPRAEAHGLQPGGPAGRGPRRRPVHGRRPRDLRVRHDADAHRLDPGLHPRLHAPPRGQGRTRATSSSTTTRTTGPRTRPTCASRSRSSGRASCIAWSASTIHLSDTGGVFPGIAIDVHDVWAESKIYDSLKLYENGVRNEQLWQFFVDNTRTPSYVIGDTEAMIAAGRLGEKRFLGLLEKYGRDTVMGAVEEFLDYCERMMRAQIESVPDGTWEAEGWLDDDGRNRGEPLYVHTKVHDRGLRHHRRPLEVLRQRADRLQRAVRRQRAARHLHGDPLRLPRRGDVHGLHPAERRDLPAHQGHRARGQHLQPVVPALGAVARVPDPARVRRRDPGAVRGRARPRRARGRARSASASTPATSRRSPSTGSTSRSTRAPTAAAAARTASTRSTCSRSTRATRRSRRPTGCSRCAPSATSCATSSRRRGSGAAASAIIRANRFVEGGAFTSETDRAYEPPPGLFGGGTGHTLRLYRIDPDGSRGPARVQADELHDGARRHARAGSRPAAAGTAIRWSATRRRCCATGSTSSSARRARASGYGVVIDETAEAVDIAATERLRAQRGGGTR